MATKDDLIRVRVSRAEKERLEQLAQGEKLSVSAYIRSCIFFTDGELTYARQPLSSVSRPAVAPAAPVEESVSVSDAIADHALRTAREVLARPVPPEARPHSIVTKKTYRPDPKR